ncbi:M28 family peptidase [Candidatus Bipolaricaulota bacterium]|jgi:hypothetical protein|nr:M28 family peptidase [Candidatus Bipolaricaulota bacterium]TFH08398.1 MAG: M28 family peptidase [Candidatus Atribacteria bacterium]
MNAMDHVRALVERVGPRGSATAEEREAAFYAHQVLTDLGLRPELQTFQSARSAWLPAALFWSFMLASGFIFLGGGQLRAIVALILASIGLVSVLLELTFRSNLLRFMLPKAEGQNVAAQIEAESDAREHVVLAAHIDSHRTPLVFSSPTWVRWFERLVPIGMAFAVVLIAIFVVGIVVPMQLLHALALVPMIVALGMLILMLQADFTAYATGANDNASGVGVVLHLAEQLAVNPLSHTHVWIVLTGCEEVGCYGADHFIRKQKHDLGNAAWITVDTVGSHCGSPVFLSQETFLSKARSDRRLLQMMREISQQHPDWGAHEIRMKGAYTDSAIAAKHKLRVLTLESHQPSGGLSHWHRSTDNIQNVSAECLQNTESLLSELLRRIDDDASSHN